MSLGCVLDDIVKTMDKSFVILTVLLAWRTREKG